MRINEIFIIVLFPVIISCENINFMGNDVNDFIVVDTKLRTRFVLNYSDSIASTNKWYDIPDKYKWLLDSNNNSHLKYKIYYFKSNPEELYFVTYNYDIIIREVYNETIDESFWTPLGDSLISKSTRDRMIQRYKNEVLSKVEEYGKLKHLPDSIMYTYPIKGY